MTTMVTESRPAKHGKRLNGKRVRVINKKSGSSVIGIYNDLFDEFYITRAAFHYPKDEWDVEEIIERVE